MGAGTACLEGQEGEEETIGAKSEEFGGRQMAQEGLLALMMILQAQLYLSDGSSSYYMERSLEQKLRAAEEYSRALEDNFRNNLQVIEEQELQAEVMRGRLTELEQQNLSLREALDRQQEQREFEARVAQNELAARAEQQEREVQEVATLLEGKYRREMEAVSQRLGQEVRAARTQLLERDESSRRVLQENSRLLELVHDLKERQQALEGQVVSLNEERNTMSSRMALHEKELDGIRACSSNWEEALKQKLKAAHEEKQKLEEEYTDYKMVAREKLKRQKEDLARNIQKLAEECEQKLREAAGQQKQLQFNLDNVQGDLREKTKELDLLRDERKKMEGTLVKYQEHERAFAWNEKERSQLQQMLEQQKRDHKLQIDKLSEDLAASQQKFDTVNTRREEMEKAVERMKVDIINKAKENDEFRKANARLEQKIREFQAGVQIQPEAMMSKPYDRAYESKGFDFVEIDHSKAFTEDMGVIDSKYFEESAARSPKHNQNSPKAQRPNREAQLMKHVSQLQLELQDCRAACKRCTEEAESLRKLAEERNREISLHRDRANVYWEKANDKEQQVNALKETNSELKASNTELSQELKRLREGEAQWRSKEQELQRMKERVGSLEKEVEELQAEVDIITKDRDMMEQISSDLRADNHALREILADNAEPEDHSFTKSHQEFSKSQQEFHAPPKEEETVPFYQPERQRFPKKLRDLVREKKMLSISGKRAAMEERPAEARLEQIRAGTESQKEVLQRIRVRNKTPPKIANYAEMKKEKERRSHQLETVSQKEVFERLKSRQNSQALSPSPDRGVNYLQLREMGAE